MMKNWIISRAFRRLWNELCRLFADIVFLKERDKLFIYSWMSYEKGRMVHNNWGDDINKYFLESVSSLKVNNIRNSLLWMTKQKVDGFMASKWLKSIIGKGMVIVALCLPLIVLGQQNLFKSSIWLKFIGMGAISMIWVVTLIWLIGMTNNERKFVISRVKNYI